MSPSDYSPYSFVAPLDPRLPGGGGYTISGLDDLNPNKVGQVDNYLTSADNFGGQIEHWNGVDVSVALRVSRGVMLQGGLSTGRTLTDNCAVVAQISNPSQYGCHAETNFLTQVKLISAYTIPKIDTQLSGAFQSIPGLAISANYVVPAALVTPSLGRNLSGGSPTVNLLQPGTLYGQRLHQLDLRLAKNIRFTGVRMSLNLDIYNTMNASAVQQQNNSFASWQVPQIIQQSRFAKISAQFNF